MRQAIRLAKRAWGRTSPNPLVGAIVCKDDQVWKGWHHKAGEAHAEINALRAAREQARGALLYVTLEPCSTAGRTGACTDAIMEAGIRRVVIGALDPNPDHAGRGVEILKKAGLEVVHGMEEERCDVLNEAFNCWIRYRRPYVILKMAMTLDGKIATANGASQWITGPVSRKRVQRLRQWADAILVGGETVRQDNPQLLVRSPKRWKKQPLRLVATRSGNLGSHPQVLSDGLAETRLISCATREDWLAALSELGAEGITSILVEGGGSLAGELLNHGLVDKVVFFVAPKILTGQESRPVVGGKVSPLSLDEARNLSKVQFERSGDDIQITGYLSNVHRYS